MARHSDVRGVFDIAYERDSIFDGIQSELQKPVGQIIDWLIFAESESEQDSIYAVASKPTGRQWQRKVTVPVFGAFIYQGTSGHNPRGFYNTDTLLVSASQEQLVREMPDIITTPDNHILDRVAYRGKLFIPHTISLLGMLANEHTIISIECRQVNPEETVNDEQFVANQNPYHVIGSEDDQYVTAFGWQPHENA